MQFNLHLIYATYIAYIRIIYVRVQTIYAQVINRIAVDAHR